MKDSNRVIFYVYNILNCNNDNAILWFEKNSAELMKIVEISNTDEECFKLINALIYDNNYDVEFISLKLQNKVNIVEECMELE